MRIARVIAACLILTWVSEAAGQDRVEILLAKPISPGAIGLLAPHTSDPRVLERLGSALSDDRLEVRAAAARVIYSAGASTLREQLAAALKVEREPRVARELLRPVVAFADSRTAARGLALEAAARLELDTLVAMTLAGVHRERALDELPNFRQSNDFPLGTFLSVASRTSSEALAPVAARALRESDSALWGALLSLARQRNEMVDSGMLAFALGAPSEGLRLPTLWYLVLRLAERGEVSSIVDTALRKRVGVRAEVDNVEERFLLEIAARGFGEAAREDDEWIRQRESRRPVPIALPSRDVLDLLTERERKALARQLRDDESAYDPRERDGLAPLSEATPSAKLPALTEPMLTAVGGYPPGFANDVLRVAGCKPGVGKRVFAEVNYSLEGRPFRAELEAAEDGDISPECESAAEALLLTHVVPLFRLGAEAAWARLVVLLDSGFLTCATDSGVEEGVLGWERGDMESPEVRSYGGSLNVDVVRTTLDSGARAFVQTRGIVDPSGCLRNVEIVDPIGNELDVFVLERLSRWRLEPARFEGRAVPIDFYVRYSFFNTFEPR